MGIESDVARVLFDRAPAGSKFGHMIDTDYSMYSAFSPVSDALPFRTHILL